jgi:oxygen-independent coproporphyrinogen-3 oxidase
MKTQTGPRHTNVIQELISRYNTPVPRYTSYPTAVEFSGDFNPDEFFNSLKTMPPANPVSLYLHIPFCESRCHYCGCNVIISRRKEMIDVYLDDIMNEIIFKMNFVPFKPKVSQLHFGGGTPNFLRISDWQILIPFLKGKFIFEDDIEQSIEIDPMLIDLDYLGELKKLGFNRVSFGVQDVNEKTQAAINRLQDMSHIEKLIDHARSLGYASVNVDFIYGLPWQTAESYQENIKWILESRPDRMAMFSYAHIPWLKKHQGNMPADTMPDAAEKLKIYLNAEEQLNKAGYVSIGLDHFALENDPLSAALKAKKLHRNFMGYTTQPDIDQLAFGPSAIAYVQGVFVQNHVKLRAYERSVRERTDFFEKGIKLTREDYIRNYIIQSIMNNLFLDIIECQNKWQISFFEKFHDEVALLREFEKNDLVKIYPDKIELKPEGRYIVRHIAKCFDAYRKKAEEQMPRFSKGI